MPPLSGSDGSTEVISSGRPSVVPLLIAYAVYVPLAVVLVVLARHQLNVDGVAYLRIAKYYAEGNFDLAISGYWAPLLSWLLIPWHLLDADPLLGTKVINALAGALFIWAVHRLAHAFDLRGPLSWAVIIGSGLLALRWLPRAISPDLLFAALLTLYFTSSLAMSRSLRARDAALAGVIGGAAYLSKYYALPFFVMHHSLAVFLVGRRPTSKWFDQRYLGCWLAGAVACLVVAGPWLSVLSSSYGRPTFATTGKYTRAYAYTLLDSERHGAGYYPPTQLEHIREGRITSWENPDEITLPWCSFSPFASVANVVTQLRLLYGNVRDIGRYVLAADGLGLMYFIMIALPLIACLRRENALGIDLWQWRWLLMTVAVYLSGLICIFAGSPRYYWPLQGLLLVLVGCGAVAAAKALVGGDERPSSRRSLRLWHTVLALVVFSACALPYIQNAREALGRPGADLLHTANRLRALDMEGTLASSHWHLGVPIAYHLDTPHLGIPRPGSAQDVTRQLASAGAETFLLFHEQSWPSGAVRLNALAPELAPPSHVVAEGGISVSVYSVPELAGRSADAPATARSGDTQEQEVP